MTEPAGTTAARSGRTRKRRHAAAGSRIIVAGLAVGSTLGLVGIMSAAAQAAQPSRPEAVRRVVVVDPVTGVVTQSVEPAPLPQAPTADRRSSPPVTQSQGS